MRSPGCTSVSSRATALPSMISRLFLPSPIYHRSDCIVLICPWICFPDWTRTSGEKSGSRQTCIPSRNPAQTAQVQEYLVGRLHPTFAELRQSQKHLPPFCFSILPFSCLPVYILSQIRVLTQILVPLSGPLTLAGPLWPASSEPSP